MVMVRRPGLWNKASLHQPRHRMMFQAAGPWNMFCHDSGHGGHDSKDLMICHVRMFYKGRKARRNWWIWSFVKHWFVTKHSLVTVFCQITGGGVETAIGTWPSRRLNLGVKGTFIWIIWMECINLSFGLPCYSPTPISTSPMNCTKTIHILNLG